MHQNPCSSPDVDVGNLMLPTARVSQLASTTGVSRFNREHGADFLIRIDGPMSRWPPAMAHRKQRTRNEGEPFEYKASDWGRLARSCWPSSFGIGRRSAVLAASRAGLRGDGSSPESAQARSPFRREPVFRD